MLLQAINIFYLIITQLTDDRRISLDNFTVAKSDLDFQSIH